MRKRGNRVGTFIVVLVLIAAVVALGVFSSGFTNWDVNTWFKGNSSNSGAIGDGENIEVDKVTPLPQNLMFTALSSETAAVDGVQLEAVISPENATNKAVTWYVSWFGNMTASDFGYEKNVTDYVTVTPKSEGSLIATVKCLQPFGSKIVVRVICRDNTAKMASCNVDYQRRISAVNLKEFSSSVAESWSPTLVVLKNQNLMSLSLKNEYSVGTVDSPTYTYSVNTGMSDELKAMLPDRGLSELDLSADWQIFSGDGDSGGLNYFTSYFGIDTFIQHSIYYNTSGLDLSSTVLNMLIELSELNKPTFTLTITAVSSNHTYTNTYRVLLKPTAFKVYIDNIEMGNGSIIF